MFARIETLPFRRTSFESNELGDRFPVSGYDQNPLSGKCRLCLRPFLSQISDGDGLHHQSITCFTTLRKPIVELALRHPLEFLAGSGIWRANFFSQKATKIAEEDQPPSLCGLCVLMCNVCFERIATKSVRSRTGRKSDLPKRVENSRVSSGQPTFGRTGRGERR
jgi:hypothetical protein